MDISELRARLADEERLFNECNDWDVVLPRLNTAISRMIEHDFELLEDCAGERSIAHRLAVYLEHEFPGWHVDCEFNRQGEEGERDPKRVSPGLPHLPEFRAGQGTADVTPDVIIHRRRKTWNLLAIEVKPSSSADLPRDRENLRKYLTEILKEQLVKQGWTPPALRRAD